MREETWLRCEEPYTMLQCLKTPASDRKVRLWACGYCRRVWDEITAQGSRQAVEAGEAFADGMLSDRKRGQGCAAGRRAVKGRPAAWSNVAMLCAEKSLGWDMRQLIPNSASVGMSSVASEAATERAWQKAARVLAIQAEVLRDVVV